jgi:hypothetical protein
MRLKHLQKHLKILESIINICNIQIKYLEYMHGTYEYPDKHTCNICLEKGIGNKSLQHTCTIIATYATS